MGYWGPTLLAYNAWLTEDASARAAYIAEAEELLAGKVLAHNHFQVRGALMELGRTLGNPDLIEDQCAKLASFYQSEAKPLSETMPFVDYLVRRGRVFAAALRGVPPAETVAEAQALLDWSARVGAVRLGAGLDAVLRSWRLARRTLVNT